MDDNDGSQGEDDHTLDVWQRLGLGAMALAGATSAVLLAVDRALNQGSFTQVGLLVAASLLGYLAITGQTIRELSSSGATLSKLRRERDNAKASVRVLAANNADLRSELTDDAASSPDESGFTDDEEVESTDKGLPQLAKEESQKARLRGRHYEDWVRARLEAAIEEFNSNHPSTLLKCSAAEHEGPFRWDFVIKHPSQERWLAVEARLTPNDSTLRKRFRRDTRISYLVLVVNRLHNRLPDGEVANVRTLYAEQPKDEKSLEERLLEQLKAWAAGHSA